jgi:hypothetical protein
MGNCESRIFKESIYNLLGIMSSSSGIPKSKRSEAIGMNMLRALLKFRKGCDCPSAFIA